MNVFHKHFIVAVSYRGYYYDSETGLYYLQSRYYDPEIGRFINADVVTDGGAGVIGTNLFIYAANNPVNNSDPSGQWIIKNIIKKFVKKVVKPIVKKVKNALSNIKATYSRGISFNMAIGGISLNLQSGISMDTSGKVALQSSISVGATGGFESISGTTYRTITNAPSIDSLNDKGYQVGGSFGTPIYGVPVVTGEDFNIIPNDNSPTPYVGITRNFGFGTPGGEIHAMCGKTKTWKETEFNVFDVVKNFYVGIME